MNMNPSPEKTIRAVLVEDEPRSLLTLKNLLQQHCPSINVQGEASTVAQAIPLINMLQPELLFLDISMPDGDGFEVLNHLHYTGFEVIFTTAYDDYAIKAFELSALHYLLKPLNYLQLQEAVERYSLRTAETTRERIALAQNNLRHLPERIALPTQNGYLFLELHDILRVEADGNYSTFFLKDKSRHLVSKPLNYFEKLLTGSFFFRIHDKHLVNLLQIKRYIKGKGGQVCMKDESTLDVSVRKKEAFLQALMGQLKQAGK